MMKEGKTKEIEVKKGERNLKRADLDQDQDLGPDREIETGTEREGVIDHVQEIEEEMITGTGVTEIDLQGEIEAQENIEQTHPKGLFPRLIIYPLTICFQ